jgi:hypothetical protein
MPSAKEPLADKVHTHTEAGPSDSTRATSLLCGTRLLLNDPTIDETRSNFADWLELSAFLSPRGKASKSKITGLLGLGADDTASERERVDESILEGKLEEMIVSVFDELEFRKNALGSAYPFDIDGKNASISLQLAEDFSHKGQVVYLFCLLATALRTKLLATEEHVHEAHKKIGNTFQICACLAAGGYTLGRVASFGFPRAEGDAFLPALQRTFSRFGFGKTHEQPPSGYPNSLKDGGIDVFAWRPFPDQMPSTMFLVGQCASGLDWHEKPVSNFIPQLNAWFVDGGLPEHALPAIFIPFPLHYDLPDPDGVRFDEALRNRWHFQQRSFGVIFDRVRIAHFADECWNLPCELKKEIDGIDSFDDVREWVKVAAGLAGFAGVSA